MTEYYIIDFGVNYAKDQKYTDDKIKYIMDDSWNNVSKK